MAWTFPQSPQIDRNHQHKQYWQSQWKSNHCLCLTDQGSAERFTPSWKTHKLGNFTKQLKRRKNTRFCQLLHQFLHTSNTKAYPKQTKNSSVSYTTLRSSTYRSPDFVGNNNRSDTTTISTVTRHQARQIVTAVKRNSK